MMTYNVIDDETIDEIAHIIGDAYTKAGKLDELYALCEWVRNGFPEKNNPIKWLRQNHSDTPTQ